VSKYKNLKILRYQYAQKNNYNSTLEKHLRGCIIDADDNIVMLPPMKSIDISISDYFENYSDIDVTPIIDGVMVNFFYVNNKWNISTRSSIGGYNKWNKEMNFKDMVDEARNFDYDDLDNEYTYSFVLRHKKNVNVSDVYFNELYLIEMRNSKTLELIPSNLYKSIFKKIDSIKINIDNVFPTHDIRGYTFYKNNIRFKISNTLFEYVKNLKGEHNDKIINILNIRQAKTIGEYLTYFPNDKKIVCDVCNKLQELVNDIYINYVNYRILRKIEKKDIEYHIKPCIDELHQIFLSTRNKISKKVVSDYVNEQPAFRLKFILNYMN
jgi:hypothetical protein